MARASGRVPHLALLDPRNTPKAGRYTSLVWRMMSRRTKTMLSTSTCFLKTKVIIITMQKHQRQTEKAKELSHTTKKLGDLPPLEARRRRSVDTTR